MNQDQETSGYRVRGWHVAAAVSTFFAVVIAFDVAFAVIAYRTHPGQVSVTPYEDGLIYNRRLAQLEAQARLGWRAAAKAEADGATVELRGDDGRPLQGLAVSARLERPATEAGRMTLTFVETAPGSYRARAPLAGAWDLTGEVRDGAGRLFTFERRLTWP